MYASRFEIEQKVHMVGEIERLNLVNYELKRQNEMMQAELAQLKKYSPEQVPDLLRRISQLENELRIREVESRSRDRTSSPRNRRNPDSPNRTRALQMELEALRKENEGMKIVKDIVEDLNRKNDTLNLEIQDKEREIDHLAAENERLKSKTAHLQDEIAHVRARSSGESAENRERANFMDKMNKKLHDLNVENQQLKKALVEQEKIIEENNRQAMKERETVRQDLKMNMSAQKREHEIEISHLKNQLRDFDNLREEVREKERALSLANSKRRDLEEEVARLQDQLARKENVQNEVMSSLNNKTGELERLRMENLDKARTIEQLENKLNLMEANHMQRLDAVNNHWETRLKSTLERELGEQFEQFMHEKKQLEFDKNRLEQEKNNLAAENSRLDSNLNRLEYEIKNLSDKLIDYENKITLLSLEIQRLNGLLEKKEGVILDLETKQKLAIDGFQANSKEWEYINQRAEAQIEHYREKATQLEEKILILLEENYKLGAQNHQFEKEIGGLKTQLRTNGITPMRFFADEEDANSFRQMNGSPYRSNRVGGEDSRNDNSILRDPANLQAFEAKIMSQNLTIQNLEEKIRLLETERGLAKGGGY